MLQFYHDLGVILYHPDAKRDLVILDPRWLINVFKSVITVADPEEQVCINAN